MLRPLLKEAFSAFPETSRRDLRDAHAMAKQCYGQKKHPSGLSLMDFVEGTTRLLVPFRPDSLTLITSLLQFATGKGEKALIEQRFGKKIPRLIASLDILEKSCGRMSSLTSASLRRMTLILSEDIAVLLIFLHNRWYYLENSDSLDATQRIILAREALNVFAPISARLGMYSVKYAHETLAFEIVVPEKAQHLKQEFEAVRRKHGSFLQESERALKRLLSQAGKQVEISSREKYLYSIYRKMERKKLNTLTDLHDLFGVRILTETEEDCYHILGIIHRTYPPIVHHMKDHIAFPKPNGYRSLHTTVLGLNRRDFTLPVEIQIRTEEMDEKAEYGIAAHWNYKEGGERLDPQRNVWQERMLALRQLSESPSREPEEMREAFQEAISDRIYALTPQGDPIELPKGGTPLDFAFRIHTDLGLQFRAARVNGFVVPIDQVLENGDIVEIIRQRECHPQEHWIKIAVTKEARSKLRSHFRKKPVKL